MDKKVLDQRIPINQIYQIAIRDEETSTQIFTSLIREKLLEICGEKINSEYYEDYEFPNFSEMTYRQALNYLNTLIQIIGEISEKVTTNEYEYSEDDTLGELLSYLQDFAQNSINEIENNIIDKYKELLNLDEDDELIQQLKQEKPTISNWSEIYQFSNSLLQKMDDISKEQKNAIIEALNNENLTSNSNIEEILEVINDLPEEVKTKLSKSIASSLSYNIYGHDNAFSDYTFEQLIGNIQEIPPEIIDIENPQPPEYFYYENSCLQSIKEQLTELSKTIGYLNMSETSGQPLEESLLELKNASDEVREDYTNILSEILQEEYENILLWEEIREKILNTPITLNIIMNGGSIRTSSQKITGGLI